jgi:uncharacterized protein YndB with AHSA1/START domain
MATSGSHRFAFHTDASAEQVWGALTCPGTASRFFHGMRLESEWAAGSPVTLCGPDGHEKRGEVIAALPPRSLSFALEQGIAPCRIIGWELRSTGDGTVVRLTVDDVDGEREEEMEDTWLPVLSGLEQVLQSGGAT